MTKPDDIPQDVWDHAELQVRRWPLATDCVQELARAIIAAKAEERAECAALADKYTGLDRTDPSRYTAVNIASAIRKRGGV